jgi:8-oxo-dGTP pyrophosphatase MutT (NUDIX family)
MSHIHDKIDFTVGVMVVFNNKVLLRTHDKYGLWLGIGGHIEPHEDPNQAAIREVKEEVGLDIELVPPKDQIYVEIPGYKELIPPRFLSRHNINQDHEHINLLYFARAKSDQITLEEDEADVECRWFTGEELDHIEGPIGPAEVQYAKAALAELKQ